MPSLHYQIIRYGWLLALEHPISHEPLASHEVFSRYKFIPNPKPANNPDGLPVGVTKDIGEEPATLAGRRVSLPVPRILSTVAAAPSTGGVVPLACPFLFRGIFSMMLPDYSLQPLVDARPAPARGPRFRWLALALLLLGGPSRAATHYLNSTTGDDARPESTQATPWKSFERLQGVRLQAGDRVLLARGQTFSGQLLLDGVAGSREAPIIVSSYSPAASVDGARATIDGRGFVAAVHLKNCRHIEITDLVVTADGGGLRPGQPPQADMRCGVLVEADAAGAYAGFLLRRLLVRDVSFEEPGFVRPQADVNTANGTARYGWGIRFIVKSPDAQLTGLTVTDCQIENVNHTGLKFTAPTQGIRDVRVERIRVLNTGGPGVQLSGVHGGHFSQLHVDHSGSTLDTRNWGRGSGLWTWGSSDIVIEKSQFLHANGPGDSAGVHIDYNCRNVIVQYNLSANNAGGFCEVLGNNFNCAYRYNISVNDGHRVKGRDGAFQEGKTFWLSGYTGAKSPRRGPTNTYFYNNTIYVSAEIAAKMAVTPTADGVLIANNIFHIMGCSEMVVGDQFRADAKGMVGGAKNVIFENNLFLRADNWPADVGIADRAPLVGDAGFVSAGSLRAEDYTPRQAAVVKNRGVRISRLPHDEVGLLGGLNPSHDILGHAIVDRPDLGAIELP